MEEKKERKDKRKKVRKIERKKEERKKKRKGKKGKKERRKKKPKEERGKKGENVACDCKVKEIFFISITLWLAVRSNLLIESVMDLAPQCVFEKKEEEEEEEEEEEAEEEEEEGNLKTSRAESTVFLGACITSLAEFEWGKRPQPE